MSQFMEELKSAMNEHMDLMSDLVEKFSGELRVGLQSAVDNFLGFFHVIDWNTYFYSRRILKIKTSQN